MKNFEEKSDLPKAVSTKAYQGAVRLAKAKLEDAYSLAVKEYTMAGNGIRQRPLRKNWTISRKAVKW